MASSTIEKRGKRIFRECVNQVDLALVSESCFYAGGGAID